MNITATYYSVHCAYPHYEGMLKREMNFAVRLGNAVWDVQQCGETLEENFATAEECFEWIKEHVFETFRDAIWESFHHKRQMHYSVDIGPYTLDVYTDMRGQFVIEVDKDGLMQYITQPAKFERTAFDQVADWLYTQSEVSNE